MEPTEEEKERAKRFVWKPGDIVVEKPPVPPEKEAQERSIITLVAGLKTGSLQCKPTLKTLRQQKEK